jgi:hypothetical protein
MDNLVVPMFWLCGALVTFCVVRAPIVDGMSFSPTHLLIVVVTHDMT